MLTLPCGLGQVTHLDPSSHDSLTSLHYAAAGPPDVFQDYITLLTSIDVTEASMKALFLNATATPVFPAAVAPARDRAGASVLASGDPTERDVVAQQLVDLHGRISRLNALHIAAQARFGTTMNRTATPASVAASGCTGCGPYCVWIVVFQDQTFTL